MYKRQPFGSLVEYHPITAKDHSRIHQFGKKVLPGLFLGYALYAGGIWKGDVLVADLEDLETMDASDIYSQRLNAKEVIFLPENLFDLLLELGGPVSAWIFSVPDLLQQILFVHLRLEI